MKILLLAIACYGISFTLPSYSQYCFLIDGEKSHKLWGAYVISGEGDKNVLASLYDNSQKILYTSPLDSREGKFEIEVSDPQLYKLCFTAHDRTEKTVSFEFSQELKIEEETLASDDQFSPINDDLAKSSKLLDTVYRNLHFYERRERAHRDLTERTCDNVLWSVLAKIIVLCILSLTQIYVLKGFFNMNKASV